MKSSYYLSVLMLLVLGLSSCKKREKLKPVEPGKIILVCDDFNVDNWYQYLDSFNKYDIKLTLYISNYHQFSPQQIGTLRAFQSRNDEIGYHTLNHPTYLSSNHDSDYINRYLQDEIDKGVYRMRLDGYYPESFAFPGDVHNEQIFDSLKTRFRHVRQGSFGYYEYWKKHKEYSLRSDEPNNFFTYALDNCVLFKLDETVNMIKADLMAGKSVSFCIHSLSEDSSAFTTSPTDFFALIRALQETKAEYVSVSEFFQ